MNNYMYDKVLNITNYVEKKSSLQWGYQLISYSMNIP